MRLRQMGFMRPESGLNRNWLVGPYNQWLTRRSIFQRRAGSNNVSVHGALVPGLSVEWIAGRVLSMAFMIMEVALDYPNNAKEPFWGHLAAELALREQRGIQRADSFA